MLLSELDRWTTDVEVRLGAAEGQALAARTAAAEALAAVGLWPEKIDRLEAVAAELQERVKRLEEGGPVPIPDPLPTPPDPLTIGPRVPIGPAAPYTAVERDMASVGVKPAEFSQAGIQAAITKAQAGSRVVLFPAGQYRLDTLLHVPAGTAFLGEGAGAVIKLASEAAEGLIVTGDGVRFSRLSLQGPTLTWSTTNRSRGIQNVGPRLSGGGWANLMVDHLEVSGCNYGLFLSGGSASVHACSIHHNLVAGMGYGLVVDKGAWALVTDCLFSDCRHMLASNGGGERPTHWEALHCRVTGEAAVPSGYRQGSFDTHGGMTGNFVIEQSEVMSVQRAGDFGDGRGHVRRCRLADCYSGFRVFPKTSGGVTGRPHDYEMEAVAMERVTVPYEWRAGCINCKVDGVLVPATIRTDVPAPGSMPRLVATSGGALELR